MSTAPCVSHVKTYFTRLPPGSAVPGSAASLGSAAVARRRIVHLCSRLSLVQVHGRVFDSRRSERIQRLWYLLAIFEFHWEIPLDVKQYYIFIKSCDIAQHHVVHDSLQGLEICIDRLRPCDPLF